MVSWTKHISAFARSPGRKDVAPNARTLASVLPACADLGARGAHMGMCCCFSGGRAIHGFGLRPGGEPLGLTLFMVRFKQFVGKNQPNP
uniref:Uncharacterized protein n=1 Tax=Saccharum spontaneum TaxID=62335 RepID=A0A678T4J5_SACSP|nr:hypothetical protein SS16G14_000006 [Saccharum spontaneum]